MIRIADNFGKTCSAVLWQCYGPNQWAKSIGEKAKSVGGKKETGLNPLFFVVPTAGQVDIFNLITRFLWSHLPADMDWTFFAGAAAIGRVSYFAVEELKPEAVDQSKKAIPSLLSFLFKK